MTETYIYKEVTYELVYVDPYLLVDLGDGSSVTKALKDLPEYLGDNKMYVIRRTSEDKKVNIQYTNYLQNCIITGFPFSTDELYEVVSEESKVEWGQDTAMYAQVVFAAKESALYMCGNLSCYRSYFRKDLTEDSGLYLHDCEYMFQAIPYNTVYEQEEQPYKELNFTDCKFGSVGLNIDDENFVESTGILATNFVGSGLYISSYDHSILNMTDCIVNIDASHLTNEDTETKYNGANSCQLQAINVMKKDVDLNNVQFNIMNRCYNEDYTYGDILAFNSLANLTTYKVSINILKYKNVPILPCNIISISTSTNCPLDISSLFTYKISYFKNTTEVVDSFVLENDLKRYSQRLLTMYTPDEEE